MRGFWTLRGVVEPDGPHVGGGVRAQPVGPAELGNRYPVRRGSVAASAQLVPFQWNAAGVNTPLLVWSDPTVVASEGEKLASALNGPRRVGGHPLPAGRRSSAAPGWWSCRGCRCLPHGPAVGGRVHAQVGHWGPSSVSAPVVTGQGWVPVSRWCRSSAQSASLPGETACQPTRYQPPRHRRRKGHPPRSGGRRRAGRRSSPVPSSCRSSAISLRCFPQPRRPRRTARSPHAVRTCSQ